MTHEQLRTVPPKIKPGLVYIDRKCKRQLHENCSARSYAQKTAMIETLAAQGETYQWEKERTPKFDFYYGIVYEYIETAPNDEAGVQTVIDFLARIGVGVSQRGPAHNWTGNVLLDMADLCTLYDGAWSIQLLHNPLRAKDILENMGANFVWRIPPGTAQPQPQPQPPSGQQIGGPAGI